MMRLERIGRTFRVLLPLAVAGSVLGASCARDDDARVVDSTAGLVTIDTTLGAVAFNDVDYRLTSDNFNSFQVAQQRIDALPEPPVVQRIDLRAPREADVVTVVRELESNEPARLAIVHSGLSVRDFVLTSLALGQALAFGNDQRVVVQPANRLFLEDNRLAIERFENRRRFRIGERPDPRIRIREDVDADDDDEDDDDDDSGRREGRGKGKAKGKGKDKSGKR